MCIRDSGSTAYQILFNRRLSLLRLIATEPFFKTSTDSTVQPRIVGILLGNILVCSTRTRWSALDSACSANADVSGGSLKREQRLCSPTRVLTLLIVVQMYTSLQCTLLSTIADLLCPSPVSETFVFFLSPATCFSRNIS